MKRIIQANVFQIIVFFSFISATVMLVNFGCNNKKNNLIPINEYKIIIKEHESIVDLIEYEGKEHLVFYNNKRNKIIYRGVYNRSIFEIPLENISDEYFTHPLMSKQINIHSADSIFLSLEENTILLINKKGELVNKLVICQELWNDIEIQISQFKPIIFSNSKLYLSIVGKYSVVSNKDRQGYFSQVPPNIVFDINENKIIESNFKFPKIFSSGKNYYEFASFCEVIKTQSLFSFGIDDTIYIYGSNFELEKKVSVPSKFMETPTPIPNDSTRNISYLRKYFITQSRYKDFIYDKYRNIYYRIIWKSTDFINSLGEIQNGNNWALMIIDENFNLMDEISFDNNIFSPIIIPTMSGIFLVKRDINNDNIIYLVKYEMEIL